MKRGIIFARVWIGAILLAWILPKLALAEQAPGTVKWCAETGESSDFMGLRSSPALGADGTIYVGSDAGSLYAINPDGDVNWNFLTGDCVLSSPAIGADGTIYVGSDDGNLHAIDPDGNRKWTFPTRDCVVSSPAIGPDGTIYVGSDDRNLYAINPDGTEKWAFHTDDWVESSPAVACDGTVYVGSHDGRLYAINPDGSQDWSFSTGGWVGSSPAIGSDGTIYVGSYDGHLYAINRDGTHKWDFATTDYVISSPAIGPDGTVYVGSDDGHLYAINPDGTEKWAFPTDDCVVSSPAIGPDGTIYLGSDDWYFYAITPTGDEKWPPCWLEAYVDSSPVIGPDGTVYVASHDDWEGFLNAICSDSAGLAESNWPMFHCNARHTGVGPGNAGELLLSPLTTWQPSGIEGGPFSPPTYEYQLTNQGDASVNWSVSWNVDWFDADKKSGSLQPHETTTITFQIKTEANSLPYANFQDKITFENVTEDRITSRGVTLTVNPRPGHLSVSPTEELMASGNPGGPFTPTSITYSLENTGHVSLDWAAVTDCYWLDLSNDSGILASGEIVSVTVSLNEHVNDMQLENYVGHISFCNTTNGIGNTRLSVHLSVVRYDSAVSCMVSSSSITLGETLVVTGQITPGPSESGAWVSIELVPPSGSTICRSVEANAQGAFAYNLVCADIIEAGQWTVRASWSGDVQYQGAVSEPRALTVSKAQSRVTLDAGSRAIKLGDLVDMSGKLTPEPDCGRDLTGREVKLVIFGPGGRSDIQSVTTSDRFGHFVLQDYEEFDALGQWSVQALFLGDEAYEESSSDVIIVQVIETAGYAVVVEGRIQGEEGILSHNKTANFVYKQLKQRGLLDQDIEYFNYETDQPDPEVEVDGSPTKTAVQQAIAEWARDKMNQKPANLYVVLVDHGLTDQFYIHPDVITPEDLGIWLETLQDELRGQAAVQEIVVLLGFCRSGSFLDELSGWNRVVIASAAADEASYKGPLDPADPSGVRDGEFFITEFFKSAAVGKDVLTCFKDAVKKTELFTSAGTGEPNGPYTDDARQHPLLEDNGDGIGENEPAGDPGYDGYLSKGLFIGVSSVTGNDPGDVQVTEVSGTQVLDAQQNVASFWARVDDNNRMRSLWLEVKAPGYNPGSGGTEQIEMDLPGHVYESYNSDENRYEWSAVQEFIKPGMYQVFFFARDDITGNESSLKQAIVYKADADNNPPPACDLLLPPDGSESRTVLMLDWSDSTDPDGDPLTYTVEISEDSTFAIAAHRAERLPRSHYFVGKEAGLKDLTTYYWRVKAVDYYGASTPSTDTWSFETDNTNFMPGWINGYVYDSSTDQSITAAVVTIGSVTLNTALGGYYLGVMPAGTYHVEANANGYNPKSYSGVTIPQGGLATKNFGLEPIPVVVTKGDCNGDGNVDLADAILALQVLAGIRPSSTVYKEWDVNGDGRIGMAEAIYVLQYLAGEGL